jgi:hypothetical protein
MGQQQQQQQQQQQYRSVTDVAQGPLAQGGSWESPHHCDALFPDLHPGCMLKGQVEKTLFQP